MKRFDVASSGPDAVVISVSGYGSDRIAYVSKAEECTPELWAQFKRWLIEAEHQPAQNDSSGGESDD